MSDGEIDKAKLRDELAKQLVAYHQSGRSITKLQPQPKPSRKPLAKDKANLINKFRHRGKPKTFREYYEERGTEWLLEQFALWANLPSEIQTYYPKQSTFVICMGGGTVSLPRIDQEILDFLNRSINAVPRDLERDALKLYFIKRRHYEQISRLQGCSTGTARNRVISAVDFIDGRISMYLELKAA